MPKLTIITVTHDRASQLQAQAMPSILAQSCQDFEWLVVNDGGDRATRQLIESLQQQQPGFALQYWEMAHPEVGFALADGRNLALDRASCDWVCYLDDDNSLTPNFVEATIAYLGCHPQATSVITQQFRRRDVYRQGELVKQGKPFLSPAALVTIADLIQQQAIFDSNGFIHRRDRSIRWNPNYRVFLDYEYFLCYLGEYGVDRCLIHWQPLVNYIQSSAGVIGSSSYTQWADELAAILKGAADYLVLDPVALITLQQLLQMWRDKAQQQQPIAAFQH
jgi:glycosyltransferase involved in cell wall biosynthesis